MKQKLIIVIMAFILITAFGACGKVPEVIETKETLKEVAEPTQGEEQIENSSVLTVAPTKTTEPSITPDYEDVDLNEPIIMTAPPFEYYISDKAIDKNNQPITLNIKSSEPNKIIDEEEWFINNNIIMNTYQVPNPYRDIAGNLSEELAKTWNDLIITKAFYDDTYIYCTYGSNFAEGCILKIYDAKSLKIVYTLDFSNYRYPLDTEVDYNSILQKIEWAEIKDNILYISHSQNNYAVSCNYMNAYITAIDLADMGMLWRTNALVSNSYNFVMIDDVIISGYGFTDEPDFLYQVDIHTGKVLEKTPLKTAPSYIIKKDNVLFVRTYNTDYEFDIIQ